MQLSLFLSHFSSRAQQAYNATAVIRQMRKLAMSGSSSLGSFDAGPCVPDTTASK